MKETSTEKCLLAEKTAKHASPQMPKTAPRGRVFRQRFTIGMAALGLALSAAAPQATAANAIEGLPTGGVSLIVGFAPGGASDLTARVFAEQVSKATGVDIVVENRPGASSQIGTNYVRRAKPDGKTLLLATAAAFTVHPNAYSRLEYDVEKDFRPIASLVDIPTAIVTGADQPYSNVKEYADWVRQHPNDATMGVAAMGGYSHLGTIGIGKTIGSKFESVIYKGASPMLIDTASSRVSAAADAAASMMAMYQSGKIKFLGLSGSERLPSLPDVPTVKEQGYPQFEMATSFYAIFAPAGTPDNVAAAWEKAFMEAAKAPEVIKAVQKNSMIIKPLDHKQLAARVKAERDAYAPIIKEFNIKLD